MRPGGFAGYYPRFPAAIPESRAGWSRVTQPFATRFPPRRGAVRLACVRRAASVHPEPGSNSPSKHVGGGARPASDAIADRIHSILVVSASSCWKGMTRLSPYHTLLFRTSLLPSIWYSLTSPGGSIRLRRTSASQYPVLKVRAVRYARCRAAGINNARDPIHRLVVISSSLFLHILLTQPSRSLPDTPPFATPSKPKDPVSLLIYGRPFATRHAAVVEGPSPLGSLEAVSSPDPISYI